MDRQLKDILSIMNRNKVNYWLDSGSLLGLIRDGKLIDGDGDIDIGVWHCDLNLMMVAINCVELEEYKIIKRSYRGQVYKIKLQPKFDGRTIDINIFRRFEDYAWCPQLMTLPDTHQGSISIFWLKKITYRTYRLIKYLSGINKSKDNRVFYYFERMAMWRIPVEYFSNINKKNFDGVIVNFPDKCDDYLEMRYKDWRKPNEGKWIFLIHDGAISKISPAQYLENSRDES